MGVIYKLKPEIKNFVLENKKEKPILSCRGIVYLVEKKFKIKVSKSTINSVIKESGLSMPVGRRRRPKRRGTAIITEGLGAILLKAADYLIGGTYHISEAIKKKSGLAAQDSLAKTEYLLYRNLFGVDKQANPDCGLWQMVNQKLSPGELSAYLINLQQDRELVQEISHAITPLFKQVRGIKITLTEGTFFYLDGQFHTVWSAPHIPFDFSATYYEIKGYINQYFQQNMPIVFFMAPGYDTPTKEFFEFVLSLDFAEKRISKLTLYGSRFEELENITLDQGPKRYYCFGLWPWQFGEYRKIKPIKEFRPFYSAALGENFYLGDTLVELSQPDINKSVTLRGCALKVHANEKARLIMLTNLPIDRASQEQLADIYLSRWPNLEETFQNYSRKIELFTYTASSQHFFSMENLSMDKEDSLDIEKLLNYYLKGLDLYVKWHFLPSGYERKDFPTMKEQFYNLKACLSRQKGRLLVSFAPDSGYPCLKALEYACRRINEREIIGPDGRRLFCRVG